MYDLVGSVYDDESPAADVLEAVRPVVVAFGGGRLKTMPELPALESESAENTSSSPNGSEWFPDMTDEVRRRLNTPDIFEGFAGDCSYVRCKVYFFLSKAWKAEVPPAPRPEFDICPVGLAAYVG